MEGNGWSEYQKLVLSQLQTLNDGQKDQGEKIGHLTTEMALVKQTVQSSVNYDDRLKKLEQNLVTSETLTKERRRMYSGALLLLSSIILPIILVLISNGVGIAW